MFSDDKPSLHLKTNVFLYLVKFFLLSINCSTEIIQFLETAVAIISLIITLCMKSNLP